jgi:hypothetical protein
MGWVSRDAEGQEARLTVLLEVRDGIVDDEGDSVVQGDGAFLRVKRARQQRRCRVNEKSSVSRGES